MTIKETMIGLLGVLIGAVIVFAYFLYTSSRNINQYHDAYTSFEELKFRQHYFILKNMNKGCFESLPTRTLGHMSCDIHYYESVIAEKGDYQKVNMTDSEYLEYKSLLPDLPKDKCF